MSANLTYTLIPAFAILYIGVIAYFHDRKNVSNILFFFICLSTVLWSLANFYSLIAPPEKALVAIRLVLFFAVPHAIFFLLFTQNFPAPKIVTRPRTFWVLMTMLLVTMTATVSPYVFGSIETNGNQVVPVPGILMPLFFVVVVGSILASIVLMVIKYLRAEQKEKRRWRFMLIGTSLSYVLLIITNFVLVIAYQNTYFVVFAPLFMLPTFFGMAYAILRYRLLNVKAIATEILTFIILATSLFEVVTAQDTLHLVLQIIVFGSVFIFSIFLVRSVLKEVESRERIQKLAEELEEANLRLKELDRQKSEFVSIASHQLRSPLTAMKGYSSMLLEGSFGPIGDKAREAVDRIFQSSQRLVVIIEDFLNLSRIEQGRMQYEFATVELRSLVESITREMEATAKNEKLYLKFENDGKDYNITADAGKVRQVVSNIIDNAIKYTEEGGISITIKRDDTTRKVLLQVQDTGIGIKAEVMPKLFQKFTRDQDAGKVNIMGTGLGLYVAKEIMIAHHGNIWVDSEGPGKGSTFYLEFMGE